MMRSLLSLGSKTEIVTRKVRDLRIVPNRVFVFAVLASFVFGGLLDCTASGQARGAKDTEEESEEELELGGEELRLVARDGLRMACRYYPGPEDKETIPVVLLHGWKGQGSDYDELALYLQSDDGGAHSVIVPDLRGHGGSTQLRPEGSEKSIELKNDRTGKPEFQAMLKYDLEAIKSFLLKEHNAGTLNIDGLTVVGSEMGAILAMYWTARDWSWEPLAGIKQGQDVKAIVLLSVPTSFKGITPNGALKQADLRDTVSMFMLYGKKDAKASSASNRLFNTVKRHRNQVFDSVEERREKQDLFQKGLETSLQGVDLLVDAELPTFRNIEQFIEGRIRRNMEDKFPWKARRRASE